MALRGKENSRRQWRLAPIRLSSFRLSPELSALVNFRRPGVIETTPIWLEFTIMASEAREDLLPPASRRV
jgi:hypothetical protein